MPGPSGVYESRKLLVVQDDPAVRALCARAVERCGFRSLAAQDGQEAVGLLQALGEETGCTVLDLAMPGMGGLPAFHELCRIRPGAKVILCSGYGEEEATARFTGQGLADFLQRPYSFEIGRAMLEEVLKD